MSLFGGWSMKFETLVLPAILLLFHLALMGSAWAAVEVSGSISGDTTWTSSDTIKVSDQVVVGASGRLTIQAGAVILFSPGSGLFVQGELRATGEKNRRILFTGAADTSGGSPKAGCWEGLRFLPHSSGMVNHCDVRLANNGIHVDQSSISLYGCTIEDFASRGIYIDGFESDSLVPMTVEYCSIRQNDTALMGSGVGILVYRSAFVTITRCDISHCQYGVQFRGREAHAPQFQMTGCTIRDHASYGIYIPWVG
jgi:hypothetical protein